MLGNASKGVRGHHARERALHCYHLHLAPATRPELRCAMGRAEPRSRRSSSHSHSIPSVLAPSLSCLYAPCLPWMLAQLRARHRPDSMLQATFPPCASLLVASSMPQPSPVPTLRVLVVTV